MADSLANSRQAGAQIEITEAMLDAGFKVFCASGITDDPTGGDRLVLGEIYQAMAARQASGDSGD